MNTEKTYWLPEGTVLKNGERKLKILSKIGYGSFGITYLAELILSEYNESKQRKVIIKEFFLGLKDDGISKYCFREGKEVKVFPDSESDFNHYLSSFWGESEKLYKLKACANTVNVIDRFRENNTCYFIMEYIEGGIDLFRYVRVEGKLNDEITKSIVQQLGNVLLIAHKEKLYHRDIKPGNILIDQKSKKAYLIDFGIAKEYIKEDGDEVKLTGLATKEFAPPEQCLGLKITADYLSNLDIFALAKIMYFCLTGTPPDFGGIEERDLDGFSEDIKTAIIKATNGSIEGRTKNINDFFEDLKISTNETIIINKKKEPNSEPIEPKPPEPHPVPAEQGNRKTLIIAISTLVIMIIFGYVGAKSYDFIKAKKAFETATLVNDTLTYQKFIFFYPDSKYVLQAQYKVDSIKADETYFMISEKNDITQLKSYIEEFPSSRHKEVVQIKLDSLTIEFIDSVDHNNFKMIKVEGGSFYMGSNDIADESPIHKVILSDYYIAEYEVTQGLWQAVMGTNPSHFKDENKPVELVSWDDCQEFLNRLNKKTGKKYRFPTEAEWEFAAKGGGYSKDFRYSGSNNLNEVACFSSNSKELGVSNKEYGTHHVGIYKPNELGIYDMSGNVWEWCGDGYGKYEENSRKNPTGEYYTTTKVSRGGSWNRGAISCRITNRSADKYNTRDPNLGLRLAHSFNNMEVSFRDPRYAEGIEVDAPVMTGGVFVDVD